MTQAVPKAERGFTLIELLVALALAALLATALSGFVRLAAQSWERTAAGTVDTEALVRLDRTLRRQVAALVQAGELGEAAGRPPLFFGAHDGFGWVARTPMQAKPPGLYGQRVRLIEGRGLVLESWPVDRPREIETAPLAQQGEIGFSYFGSAYPGEAPRWHASWAPGPVAPRVVRLTFPDGSGLPPLSLAVP